MDDLHIGGDDHRILTYARLVDPEVWPDDGDPEVSPATVWRLRRSIEAGHRIAAHDGGVADPSDAVERLCRCYGLSAEPQAPMFALVPGLDPERIAALALLLQGEGPEHEATATVDDEVSLRSSRPAEDAGPGPADQNPQDDGIPMRDASVPDYNHDAEDGIAYVGDPDDDMHRGDGR